jgi:hypothetical protein
MVYGSWFLVPGSWFLVFGSWLRFFFRNISSNSTCFRFSENLIGPQCAQCLRGYKRDFVDQRDSV